MHAKWQKYHRPSMSIEIVYANDDDDEPQNPVQPIKHRKSQSFTHKMTRDRKVDQSMSILFYKQRYAYYKRKYQALANQLNHLKPESNIISKESHCNVSATWKRAVSLLLIGLIAVVFVDCYLLTSSYYFSNFVSFTLAFMGVHLVLEQVLEEYLKSFNIQKRLYQNTACCRDIINNVIIVCLFIYSENYSELWRPAMWGSYICDIVMLLKKWKYITSSWLTFTLCHHFWVGVFLLILQHSVAATYTINVQICTVIFLTSNTFGVFTTIWKTFKWFRETVPCLYEYCSVITFSCQRVHRISCFVYAFYSIHIGMFYLSPSRYLVLFIFAFWMDCVDIYFQLRSILRYLNRIR